MTERHDAELDFAIRELRRNYKKAISSPYIHTPVAWALYHTWRTVDASAERKRKEARHERPAAALADPGGGIPGRKETGQAEAEAGSETAGKA